MSERVHSHVHQSWYKYSVCNQYLDGHHNIHTHVTIAHDVKAPSRSQFLSGEAYDGNIELITDVGIRIPERETCELCYYGS